MQPSLVIQLPLENRTHHGPLYIGGRRRDASATAVKIIDPCRLVYVSLIGKRLYLTRLDWQKRTYEVVTIVDERLTTDLIDFDGRDLIVTSNCEDRSVSFYRLEGDEIRFERDVPIRDPGAGYCHGAKFVPDRRDLVCATCNSEACGVYFLSTATGQVVYGFAPGWGPKDVAFVDARRMIVICAERSATREARAGYRGKIVLLEVDIDQRRHRVLDEALVEGHVDSCTYDAGRLYVNNQTRDVIHQYRVEGDALQLELDIGGYDFPHGVDVAATSEGALLAVSNYGNNTVDVRRIEGL